MVPLVRNLSRYLSTLCGIAFLAAGLSLSGYFGRAPAQATGEASLSARINPEFLAVKMRAAQIQPELSRLDQALETLAVQLKDRPDLSPAAKASRMTIGIPSYQRDGKTSARALASSTRTAAGSIWRNTEATYS